MENKSDYPGYPTAKFHRRAVKRGSGGSWFWGVMWLICIIRLGMYLVKHWSV